MQNEIISSGNILLAGPEFETPLLVVMNLTLNCYGAVANIFIGNIQRSRLDHINIYSKEMLKVIKTFLIKICVACFVNERATNILEI